MACHRHIPVVAVVSTPPVWVGARTLRRARRAKSQLQRTVNALTVISCDQIVNAHEEYTQDDLFEHVNRLMQEAVEKWVKGFWRLKYF
jgi:cell division GTPase FtsZ